jgi:hypothetical protein
LRLNAPQVIAPFLDLRSLLAARGVSRAWRRRLSPSIRRLSVQPHFLHQASGGGDGGGITAAQLLDAFPAVAEMHVFMPLGGPLSATEEQAASLAAALVDRCGDTLTSLELEAGDETSDFQTSRRSFVPLQLLPCDAPVVRLLSGAVGGLRALRRLSLGMRTALPSAAVSEAVQHLSALSLTSLRLSGADVTLDNSAAFCPALGALTSLRALRVDFHARFSEMYTLDLAALSSLSSLSALRLGLRPEMDEELDATGSELGATVAHLAARLPLLVDLYVGGLRGLVLPLSPSVAARLQALRAYGAVAGGDAAALLDLPRLRRLRLDDMQSCVWPWKTPALTRLSADRLPVDAAHPVYAWLRGQTTLEAVQARARRHLPLEL